MEQQDQTKTKGIPKEKVATSSQQRTYYVPANGKRNGGIQRQEKDLETKF